MKGRSYDDVEFGEDLVAMQPNVGLANVSRFCHATGMLAGRFMDHEAAKAEGLAGAIVPGIMSQGLLVAMIHNWAPGCEIRKVDTVFRAPLLVDSLPTCRAVVTDKNDDARTIEIDLTIVNEEGETRVMGTATVQL